MTRVTLMNHLERFRPDPIPVIHPLPEYLASGQRAAWYDETKQILQVPWMGVVTMAYTHYPTFFNELWRGLKPLCESQPFITACKELRQYVEMRAAELGPAPLVRSLSEMGYASREIDNIRQINTVFSHGNQPYVLIAAITRYLLEGGDMMGEKEAESFKGTHAPIIEVPFVLMEPHHADKPLQSVYDDIKKTLNLPFVNTDYRALARWPSYFSLAWADLRRKADTPAHEAICQACHDRVAELAAIHLPNPGDLSSASLRRAAEADASLDEVIQVSRLFQWLLPGLITNIAYLRHQLEVV